MAEAGDFPTADVIPRRAPTGSALLLCTKAKEGSRAGCLPGECFYTDDIAAYVDAARQMGIDAVQFESREQIEREMRGRGIAW